MAAAWVGAGGAYAVACVRGGDGLLVTAAAVQRPDLYAAVIAAGPLRDMVRYERFGLGHTWTEEFGTADLLAFAEECTGLSPKRPTIWPYENGAEPGREPPARTVRPRP
ncbi:hypothetical protein GCM10010151_11340 [Actinoallomurus spadix]|uniref:Uncharacterized protein n=2 Tax=Actinoallomurus spadix TaxID=79912 RepID=A0ABP3FT83_9ACTN